MKKRGGGGGIQKIKKKQHKSTKSLKICKGKIQLHVNKRTPTTKSF